MSDSSSTLNVWAENVGSTVTQHDVDTWAALSTFDQLRFVLRNTPWDGTGKMAFICTVEDGKVWVACYGDNNCPASDKLVRAGQIGIASSQQLASFIETLGKQAAAEEAENAQPKTTH